jgi:hypothetical protein
MNNMQPFVHSRQENRRSGRTTRAVDEMVQHLFNHGVVELWDHAEHPNNLAFDCMKKVFFDRLSREHYLRFPDGLDYDFKAQIVRLKNFTK